MLDPAIIRQGPPGPYGYVAGGVPVPMERDALLSLCLGSNRPEGVWTPETGGVVPPFEVPWIFAAALAPARAKAYERLKATGFMLGLWGVLGLVIVLSAPGALRSGPPLLLILSGVWFGQALLEHRRLQRLTPAAFVAQLDELRALPKWRAGTPLFTRALAAAIGAVALAQVLSPGSSADAAGLVKDAVRHGEWWRLLTAPLLHGGVLHLLFNTMALLALGEMVERLAHRAYLPLVFLVAALAGGAGSFVVFPHAPSVGASGGIMGLIGFTLVLSLRRRELLPRKLAKSLLADVGWVAAMGLAGYRYIDNGAHAGGLLAGALLGLLLVPRGGDAPHWEPPPAVRVAGWASLAVVAASAAAAIAAMFGAL